MGCKKLNNFISNNITNLIRTRTIDVYKNLSDIPYYDNHIIDVNSYIFADIAQLIYSISNRDITIKDRINSIQIFINKFKKLINENPKSTFHLVFDHIDYNYKLDNDLIIKIINNTFNLNIEDLDDINIYSIKNEERNKRQNNKSSDKKIFFITSLFNELKKNNFVEDNIDSQIININILNSFTFYNFLIIKYILSDIENVKLYNSSYEADITIGALITKYKDKKNIIYSNDSDMIIHCKGCDILRKFKLNITKFTNYRYSYILHTNKFYINYLCLSIDKISLLPILLECDYIENCCFKNILDCSNYIRTKNKSDIIKLIDKEKLIKTCYCYVIFNNPEIFDNLNDNWNNKWNEYYTYLYFINSIKIKYNFREYYYCNLYNTSTIYKEFIYIEKLKSNINKYFDIQENLSIIESLNIDLNYFNNISHNICNNINNENNKDSYNCFKDYSKDFYIENIEEIINQIDNIRPFYLFKILNKINLSDTENTISNNIISEQEKRTLSLI